MSEAHPFEIVAGDDGVVWLSGELDMAQTDRFAEVTPTLVDGRSEIVLELSQLTFLDSSGIRAVLALALGHSRTVILRNPNPNVLKVLSISGVGELASVRIEP
jgi:anti-anti-sigma factor